jgi:hypothetical protein
VSNDDSGALKNDRVADVAIPRSVRRYRNDKRFDWSSRDISRQMEAYDHLCGPVTVRHVADDAEGES